MYQQIELKILAGVAVSEEVDNEKCICIYFELLKGSLDDSANSCTNYTNRSGLISKLWSYYFANCRIMSTVL